MKIYKSSHKTNLYFLLGFVILLFTGILLSGKISGNLWILLIAILAFYFLYNLLTSKLTQIQINNQNSTLTLVSIKYLNSPKTETFDLENIEYSYKKHVKTFKWGLRDVCSIYYSDKIIAQIIPHNDGWEYPEINNFVKGLNESGIKRKSNGDFSTDVKI